jgi:ubiquinone/menaquinone biosynthesis C-methylase UbiE
MSEHREFLPAAGRDVFLPLYDPLVRLMGFERTRQELISQANIKPDHHILDIGCGTGTFVVLLKREFETAQVVGIDPDPKALHRAKKKIKQAAVSVRLDEGFADKLPYAADSFDRVFSSFMFHHLEEHEKKKTLQEVRRVLKPGGSFHLLDFTAGHGSHGFLARFVHSHAQLKDNTDDLLVQLMNDAGFTNAEKLKESSMFFGLLRTAYFRASA